VTVDINIVGDVSISRLISCVGCILINMRLKQIIQTKSENQAVNIIIVIENFIDSQELII